MKNRTAKWNSIRNCLLLITLLLALSLASCAAAGEIAASGTFESGGNWTLDSEGVLTFSGGEINSYYLDYDIRMRTRKVVLGPDVQSINAGGLGECPLLDEFIVDAENPYYTSYESALFNKDLTTLVMYPSVLQGSFTIPDSVTVISRVAFENTHLSEIWIPEGVSVIPNYFVSMAKSLTAIHVPSSLTRIIASAFRGVGTLTDIYYAGNMADWQNIAITDNENEAVYFATVHCADGDISPQAAITGSIGENVTYSLAPDGTLTVSGAGEWEEWAFEGNRLIKRVILEAGVTEIGYGGLYWTENVSEVIIPDTVTKIGYEAVYACKQMTSVTIPASVTTIENEAFNGCDKLETVYFGGTMEAWRAMVDGNHDHSRLEKCTVICSDGTIAYGSDPAEPTSGTIGDLTWQLNSEGVLTISGEGELLESLDFNLRQDIQKVYFGAGVSYIAPGRFSYSYNLTEFEVDPDNEAYKAIDGILCSKDGTELIECPTAKTGYLVIPEDVVTICDDAFIGNHLYSVTLPAGLETIGSQAFWSSEYLTEITLPALYRDFSSTTFNRCQAMTAFHVAEGNTNYTAVDGILYSKDGTVLYRVPGGKTGSVTVSGVKDIYAEAFRWCEGLTDVALSEGVETIGSEAFYGSAVQSLNLPASLRTIQNGAFYNMNQLTNITYAGSLAEWQTVDIGGNNDSLQFRTVHCLDGDAEPAPITGSIGDDPEQDVTYALTLDGHLTVSGSGPWQSWAFGDNSKIQYAVLEPGVTEIGWGAFFWATNLKTITIPDTVTEIKYEAFYACRSLESITIPGSVTSLGNEVFNACDLLSEIHFGGTKAEWQALTEGTENSKLEACVIYCTDGTIGEDETEMSGSCTGFDWTLRGNDLTVDGDIFSSNSLPDQVKEKAYRLYVGAGIMRFNFNSHDLPELQAYYVDENNEYYCSEDGVLFSKDMTSLVAFPVRRTGSYSVPAGVEVLEFDAFMFSELSTLVLPEGLQRVELQAIYSCRELTEITIPASVTFINGNAGNFRYCDSLENIFVAPGNTVYEDRDGILYEKESDTLFAYPAGRRTEEITVTATIIGTAFTDNKHVRTVTFAEGVTGIEEGAFGSSTVSSVFLPASIQYIGSGAFSYTPLSDVHYAGTVAQWQEVRIDVNNDNLIANVQCADGTSDSHDYSGNLGEGISYIMQEDTVIISGAGSWDVSYAFVGCTNIVSAVLEPGVTDIGWGAFGGCQSMRTLEIPVSLNSIQGYALNNCTGLTDIYYAGTREEWAAIQISEYGNDILNSVTIHYLGGDVSDRPVLTASVDASSYDYGGAAVLTAAVTNPDGSTEGLDALYPDAHMEATLLTAGGEAVPGFITQNTSGLEMRATFPLADDSLAAGYYKIRVETNIEGLSAETETFYYTAEKTGLPDPAQCSVVLTVNAAALSTEDQIVMTAAVTDQEGNPAQGIKVLFEVFHSDYSSTDFFGEYTGLWNVTGETGKCSIRSIRGEELTAGKYIIRATIVDTDISDERAFVYYWNKLVLPASLRTIEEEAFENLAAQAVFIPEGCESIGPHAFRGCESLLYVRIPSGTTAVDATAFEGCSPDLVIDRGE